MKKIKKAFVNWLLKEIQLGYTIDNNKLTNCKIEHSSINIETSGNIILDKVNLPDGVELILKKK